MIDLGRGRQECLVGDAHLSRVDTQLPGVSQCPRLEAFSAGAIVVAEVRDDLIDDRNVGETCGEGHLGSGVGHLVVGLGANPVHVGDEVLGPEVGGVQDGVAEQEACIGDPERSLDPPDDGEIEAPIRKGGGESVEPFAGFDFRDHDAGESVVGKGAEVIGVPGSRLVVDPDQDRNLCGQFRDGDAHLVAAGLLRIRGRGVFQVDDDGVGSAARHLAQEVGTNRGSEEERAKSSWKHAGTLGADLAPWPGPTTQGGTLRERGVNRVVMAVRDLDAGRRFYEDVLGCTFHQADEEEAAAFGVRILMSWDGGVELVAPIPGAGSHIERILDARGEGLVGVVWAVEDADASRAAAERLGHPCFFTLDYDQEKIDQSLQGRFSRYYEHFLAAGGPFGDLQVLVGEFDPR